MSLQVRLERDDKKRRWIHKAKIRRLIHVPFRPSIASELGMFIEQKIVASEILQGTKGRTSHSLTNTPLETILHTSLRELLIALSNHSVYSIATFGRLKIVSDGN